MFDIFYDIETYSPDDVLNPVFLLLTNDLPKSFYHYFKEINKPLGIYSLTGIKIELPDSLSLHSFINPFSKEAIETLQFNLNKLLKLNNHTFFITLFNVTEQQIIELFSMLLKKVKKEKPIIGIFICHPLTNVNEFIRKTDNQLINAKTNKSIISLLNTLDYER